MCFTGLDLLPFTVTFLMSFWQIQYGIIGGIATSGALLLYNVARPQIKVSVNYNVRDKANLYRCVWLLLAHECGLQTLVIYNIKFIDTYPCYFFIIIVIRTILT